MSTFPARVHFDFNDLSQDGTAFVLQRHAEAGRELSPGDLVLLQDCEGNSMFGHVTGADAGKATVAVAAGSWCAWAEPPAPRVVGWRCEHLTVTVAGMSSPGKVTTGCGCDMHPVYLSDQGSAGAA